MQPFSLSMIYGLTDSQRFLYHYTRQATAKLIAENLRLRFAPYTETNDPKENKDWRFWLAGSDEDLRQSLSNDVSASFSRALKGVTRVACFCTDSAPLTGDPIRDISNRGLAKPRMWQQYGENHEGVCFVFDRAGLAKAIAEQVPNPSAVYSGEVSYVDRLFVTDLDRGEFGINVTELKRIGLDLYVGQHAHFYHRPLFFEKLTDWRQEREFRWVVLCRSKQDVLIDVSQCLVGVVFGQKADPIEPILKLLTASVQTIRFTWINGCPWYDFTDLRCQHESGQQGKKKRN